VARGTTAHSGYRIALTSKESVASSATGFLLDLQLGPHRRPACGAEEVLCLQLWFRAWVNTSLSVRNSRQSDAKSRLN